MKNLGRLKETTDKHWWVGEIHRCWKCKNRFALEEADVPEREEYKNDHRDDRDGGGPPDLTLWKVRCSICDVTINVRIVEK